MFAALQAHPKKMEALWFQQIPFVMQLITGVEPDLTEG
jgi:hypothetical protein